jgi:hypothetical protein
MRGRGKGKIKQLQKIAGKGVKEQIRKGGGREKREGRERAIDRGEESPETPCTEFFFLIWITLQH